MLAPLPLSPCLSGAVRTPRRAGRAGLGAVVLGMALLSLDLGRVLN